ncbi:centrosomal protein of 83 kDa-like, partial [Actinia tenebrosa]|uniref:Centrosomal protein of 83 kDa-like n=1 Tax=Actinia tenebrosa TaxID=6105 RepID=A0A6P8HRZ9_ACTTE
MDESMEKEQPDDFDRLVELLPDCDPKKAIMLFDEDNEWGKEIILGRLPRSGSKVYVIKDERGRFFADPKIPTTLKQAIGKPNLAIQEQMSEEQINIERRNEEISTLEEEKLADITYIRREKDAEIERLVNRIKDVTYDRGGEMQELTDELQTAKKEKDTINKRYEAVEKELNDVKAKQAETMQSFKDAVEVAKGLDERLVNSVNAFAEAEQEGIQLRNQIAFKDEQIRQLSGAVEDLEHHANVQREIIADQTRPEEERAAAERELETTLEKLEEVKTELATAERERGLTTKEKIKRLLVKYGIPLAFAVAISTVVGVILSALKATCAGVKKLGNGLTNLGKKMAAGLPGLL